MSELVLVEKDPNNQKKIPSIWRETLSEIVDALREGDFQIKRGIADVPTLSESIAKAIEESIEDYGMRLVSLPEETWSTSACQWMGDYWDALIDLFTVEEGVSDLVLSVRVRESNTHYSFEIHSVHVP